MFRRFRQHFLKLLRHWWRYCSVFNNRQTHTHDSAGPATRPNGAKNDSDRNELVRALNRTLAGAGASHPIASETRSSKTGPPGTREKAQPANRPGHPDLIKSFADSAYVCKCQGRFGEAERLYRQALTLSIRRFGKRHLSIAPHLTELSALYCLQKRYEEAKSLLSSALKIYRQFQVENHPDIGEVCSQLAEVHWQLQDYRTAEKLLQSALKVFRAAYGPQHRRTKAVYSDLMRLIAIAIESGKFEELIDTLPPLDLDTLSDTYGWAKPTWMKQHQSKEDYSHIKLNFNADGSDADGSNSADFDATTPDIS